MEKLKESKFHADGHAFQLRMDLKETKEEEEVEKLKAEIEKLKAEIEKLNAEMEKLKESKFHADGQAFQSRMDLKETKEEEVEKLKAEIEKLNAEIEKLNAEIEKFQSNADIEKLNAEIEKFQSNAEIEKLNSEMEKLKESKFHADGQAVQSRMDLKETREENTNLKIVQKSQSDSRLELEKMVFFLHKLIFSHNLGRVYICLLCHAVKCCCDSIWFKSGNLFIVNYIEYTLLMSKVFDSHAYKYKL